MKKILLIGLTACSLSLFAQQKPGPKAKQTPADKAKTEVASMKKELGLNADQEKKMQEALTLKFTSEDKAKAQMREAQAQMRKTRMEYDAKVDKILTAEQKEKMKKSEAAKRKGPQKGPQTQQKK